MRNHDLQARCYGVSTLSESTKASQSVRPPFSLLISHRLTASANSWNRYVLHGDSDPNSMDVEQTRLNDLHPLVSILAINTAASIHSKSILPKSGGKGKTSPPFTSLPAAIHEAEKGFHEESSVAHTFEVRSYTLQTS